ncbi:MAG: TatD family hydrolase [Cyclobacteriaceae bacterium]
MNFIDSHAHIFSEEFNEDVAEVINNATEAGVTKICMPNIDHESIDNMLELEERYPKICYSMMGLHPCYVTKNFEKQLYEVEEWLSKRQFIAVGEMGTDLYWDKSLFKYQKEAFKIQCELALKYQLPIVIHCRESIDETIELVELFSDRGLKGVFHCFTGDVVQLRRIENLGFYIGIGGVATFKNGGLEEVLMKANLERLVLETDSPYLSPVPFRGKRNEPVRIYDIAVKIAEVRNINIAEIAETTTQNSKRLFKLE